MPIKLDELYRIEQDAFSWNLVKEVIGQINPKTGKPMISKEISYHPNFKTALVKYCDESLKPCNSAEEMLDKLLWLNAQIEALDLGGIK